jgi:hypothetical protein
MDEDAGRLEFEQRQSRISDDGLAWYREQLNPAFERDHPTEYAALKASTDRALQGSGQSLDTAPDPRSTPQQIHDARFGVSYDGDRVTLPGNLQAAIDNDTPADPHDAAQRSVQSA